MFEEKRPTAISVVGWAWIVLGAFAMPTGLFYVAISLTSLGADVQPLWYSVPIGTVQFAIGLLGLIGGIAYLRLKPWSRSVLETISWLTMLLFVGSAVSTLWWPGGFPGLGWVFGAAVLGFTALYCVPFVLMVRSLRSDKVRGALGAPAQQAHRADAAR